LDFVGIQETKKVEFLPGFLKNLTTPVTFNWFYLPAKGTAGGILLGVKEENFAISNISLFNFSISCMVADNKKNFSWKIVVVYDSSYDDRKIEFIDELHTVMASCQGAILWEVVLMTG
jgi:hypothetical protein